VSCYVTGGSDAVVAIFTGVTNGGSMFGQPWWWHSRGSQNGDSSGADVVCLLLAGRAW
jgi:hypothetical protein